MHLTYKNAARTLKLEAFQMVRNSAQQIQKQLKRSKKGYIAITLTLAIVASFLLIFYFGPFGGIKNFGSLSSKKLKEQDSKAAQFPIDLKAYYSNEGRAKTHYLDGFRYNGTNATGPAGLWFEQQYDPRSFKMYNIEPYNRCYWDFLGWWDDNTFRYTKTHNDCGGGGITYETVFDPPIIFLPRYWDGNPWTLSSSSQITTTENGVVVCKGITKYTATIKGIEEYDPGSYGIHWLTEQTTDWEDFENSKCNGWADTKWQEDYWFYDFLPVDGGQPDKGLKRSVGGVVGGSGANWDVWFDHWKPLPLPLPSPLWTPTPTPIPTPTPVPTPSPAPSPGTTIILGNTVVGNREDDGDFNHINATQFTTGALGGILDKMSVNVKDIDSSTTKRNFELAVYSDNGGKPGTLLAKSARGTFTASNAWGTVAFSGANRITLSANTKYWLAYNTNSASTGKNNMSVRTLTGAKSAWSNAVVTFGTWPATFNSTAQNNDEFSIYATLIL